MRINKDIVSLTEAAKARIIELVSSKEKAIGLRIGIKKGGCAGMEYVLELVEQEFEKDDKIIFDGGILFIDFKATIFLFGTEIDYEETAISSGFKFNNPNQISACGCGESVELMPAKLPD